MNNKKWLQAGLMIFSIVMMGMIEPFTLSKNDKLVLGLKNFANLANYYRTHAQDELDFRKRLREAVGEGTTVSTPEAASYHLYRNTIYYYPVGIDSVDVVVLKYDPAKSGDQRFYSINYGQQDPNLDACIFERMKKGGFDFDHPTIVNGWAIIKRKK